MVFTFLVPKQFNTVRPTRLPSGKDRRGSGRAIISEMLGGGDKKSRRRKLETRSVQLVVKKTSKLNDAEVRARNDEECLRLSAFGQGVEATKEVFQKNPALSRLYAKKLNDFDKVVKMISVVYDELYKSLPPGLMKKPTEFKLDELATIYMGFVIEKGIAEPSQSQLEQFSNVSQSTWSRVFDKQPFWDEVNNRIERVWNARESVQENIAKLQQKKVRTNETTASELEAKGLKYESPDDGAGEDAIYEAIDSKRFDDWDNERFIREFIKKNPTLKRAELKELTLEELRLIAVRGLM